MKRAFDLVACLCGLAVLLPPMLAIAVLVKITSKGPVLYWSNRVGKNNRIFSMPKFRTMRINTPEVATHLLSDSRNWITPVGKLLRASSLDELPQLWSVLAGDMSLVGPRPALHNQQDLIALRTVCGVHQLTPGITGWAQINGRDELSIPAKVELDAYYLQNQSLRLDFVILFRTVVKVSRQEGVRQADEVVSRDEVRKAA